MFYKIAYLTVLVCFMLLGTHALAQDKISAANKERFKIMEDSILLNVDSMYTAVIPDTRLYYCEKFVKQLVRTLKLPNSFYYGFDSLGKKISIIYPEDKSFRMFNWQIIPSEVSRRYYAAVQMPTEELKLYPLIDYTEELGKYAADSMLSGGKWYGALYYRIITHTVGDKTVYTLFGMNASNPLSNKKVMDPMMIDGNGISFGAELFNMSANSDGGTKRPMRFIIEYKKGVQASMNWDDDMKLVFFDKLVSQNNDPNRKYTFVPSGEYDGFKWDKERWNYVTNLIPVQNLKDGEAPGGVNPIK
jgi:hypothetical protein